MVTIYGRMHGAALEFGARRGLIQIAEPPTPFTFRLRPEVGDDVNLHTSSTVACLVGTALTPTLCMRAM